MKNATAKAGTPVNEFNQQVKPVSLWADAWKRLKKNRMALIGLYIAAFYILVGLLAPILPIYEARGLVARVDGMADMDVVTAAIEKVLG